MARFRVATLNIWGAFADWRARLAILAREWAQIDADVLLLQEVWAADVQSEAAEIAAKLDLPHVVATTGARFEEGAEGVAILSRRPLHAPVPLVLPGRRQQRRAIVVELAEPLVRVASAHLVAHPAPERAAQLDALLGLEGERVIIGGDLNEAPEGVAPRLADAGLVDALDGATEPATWPVDESFFLRGWHERWDADPPFPIVRRRVDYLLSRGITPLDAGVEALGGDSEGYASDHALVWADYE